MKRQLPVGLIAQLVGHRYRMRSSLNSFFFFFFSGGGGGGGLAFYTCSCLPDV